jgi:acetyl-CoA/propionyl-CoA carboxylase biotin carboxyl carrier protein
MLRALDEYEIEGLTTLIPFHKAILATDQWANGETCRDLVGDRDWLKSLAADEKAEAAAGGAEQDGEMVSRDYKVEVGGKLFDVKVIGDAVAAAAGASAGGAALKRPPKRERSAAGGGAAASGDDLVAPLQGNVFKVRVEKGQEVKTGDVVVVIEAMKMENEITAHKDGKVAKLAVQEGAAVNSGDLLATIE